jgi:hypothetical protein
MPYKIHMGESYCVDAAWFYCLASGMDELDGERFESAVAATKIEDPESAVTHLVLPHLAAMGFRSGQWSIFQVTGDFVDYEGFPLTFGDYYISFEDDSIATEDTESLPASKTIHFTQAAQNLVKKVESDEWTPVTLIWTERLEREEVEEEEDEE